MPGDGEVMALYLGSAGAERKGVEFRSDVSSFLRKQEPITTGVHGSKKPRPHRKNERSRGMGPGVRRDDDRYWSPYATASKHQARMPFCACRRFSASSNTTDCGPSITSSVTSSPRWAGRQCMNSASGLASDISLALT